MDNDARRYLRKACWRKYGNTMSSNIRVTNDLKTLQYKSELNVAFLQLAVILLFALFYNFFPTSHTPDAPIKSAPLGLALFTILVLVRLWFSYTKQLSNLFMGVAAVTEMALLMFIIWSYHIQFEDSPLINLQNSYLYYVFILIALKALRFEPIWVILSGVTAAIGWCIILWHAIDSTHINVLTWDYLTYTSTLSVHLGAEFDLSLIHI